MKEELGLFFRELFEDPEFRESFAGTNSAEEGYQKAKKYLEGVTFEEFKEGLIEISSKFLNKSYRTLSSEELDAVSGGGNAFSGLIKIIKRVDNIDFEKALFPGKL